MSPWLWLRKASDTSGRCALRCCPQDILENVTSVHARLAGIEKAVAGIKGIEGLVMRDKALELGLQYNMEELKKKLDGLQSAHPAMASTRLEEGIGGLYEEMRRFHAATMAAVQRVAAKTDAIEAVVGRMASTVGARLGCVTSSPAAVRSSLATDARGAPAVPRDRARRRGHPGPRGLGEPHGGRGGAPCRAGGAAHDGGPL